VECRRLELRRVLLTCAADNEPSRRMILANGGIPDVRKEGKGNEARFWITPSDGDPEGAGVSR
jgi:predicted acetyltransferase